VRPFIYINSKAPFKISGRTQMKIRRFAASTLMISVLLACAGAARGEVRNIQMKIAGYLCGNRSEEHTSELQSHA